MSNQFHSVVTADETGVYSLGSFALSDDVRAPMRPDTFTLCEIAGLRIAVFFESARLTAPRTDVAAAKPDWIDAILFAEVPSSSDAMIRAEVLAPANAPLATCGFAAAVVARSHGAFDVEPTSCVVSFPQGTVTVTIDFDWDSESYFGEATLSSN